MISSELVTFIDVEASGLKQPESYPIEVGWADSLGNSESFLIRPLPHWTYWDEAAEELHSITREQLWEEGIPVDEAAWRLDAMLGVESVYCDALDYDGFWLGQLFRAAGREPAFRLADVYQLYAVMGTRWPGGCRPGSVANRPCTGRARMPSDMRQPTGNSSLALIKPLDGWSHSQVWGRQTCASRSIWRSLMAPMHNPPHPGETLREDVWPALGINVTEMAHRLGLSQKTLIRVLHERAPISSDLAVRLERAGIGRARTWLAVQGDYDDWQAEHREPYSPGTEPDK